MPIIVFIWLNVFFAGYHTRLLLGQVHRLEIQVEDSQALIQKLLSDDDENCQQTLALKREIQKLEFEAHYLAENNRQLQNQFPNSTISSNNPLKNANKFSMNYFYIQLDCFSEFY